MRKVLFLDRDGVINKDVSYLYKISDLEWVDGAKEALAYAHSKGYDLIVVTNQSGVARGYHKEGIVPLYAVECECRKPKPGMIKQAIKDYDVNISDSFLIGDSQRDVDAAEAAGIKGYLFKGSNLLDFIKTII